MARRSDAADGHRNGDRTRAGAYDVIAHARDQALSGLLHVVRRAVVKNDAELVAGEAAKLIATAHLGPQALGHRTDRLVGNLETVGFVEAREIVDRYQHKAAGIALRHRLLERCLKHLGEMEAVHLAGEPIKPRQVSKPLLLIVALVDNANDTMRPYGLAIGTGEPTADVLDPEGFFGAGGMQRVLHLIGHAGALVTRR